MGKFSSSAPKAPDPYKTAAAESQFNRIDTYSPDGSGVRYGYTDANGNFVQGVAPKGQQAAQSFVEGDFLQQLRMMMEPAATDLVKNITTSFSGDGLPGPAAPKDTSAIAGDIFNRNLSMLQPEMDRQSDRLLSNLQARGLPVGSEAFDEAYDNQTRRTNETLTRLAEDSRIAAGAEQTRQFNIDSAARGGALQELVALMGGQYSPTSPVPTGSAQPVNYSAGVNNQYNAELKQYEADRAAGAQAAGALGSLGAAAIMKCVSIAKNVENDVYDIADCVDAIAQLPIKAWRYKPGEEPAGDGGALHIGPMAEDWHRLTGLGDGTGISVIDYFGVLTAVAQYLLHKAKEIEDMERLARYRLDAIARFVNFDGVH